MINSNHVQKILTHSEDYEKAKIHYEKSWYRQPVVEYLGQPADSLFKRDIPTLRKEGYWNDGKVKYIYIWHRGCLGCEMQLPEKDDLYLKLKDKMDFVFVNSFNTSEVMKKYTDYKGYTIPIFGLRDIYEKGEPLGAWAKGYHMLPAQILVDKKGIIRFFFDGQEKYIDMLLAEN